MNKKTILIVSASIIVILIAVALFAYFTPGKREPIKGAVVDKRTTHDWISGDRYFLTIEQDNGVLVEVNTEQDEYLNTDVGDDYTQESMYARILDATENYILPFVAMVLVALSPLLVLIWYVDYSNHRKHVYSEKKEDDGQ